MPATPSRRRSARARKNLSLLLLCALAPFCRPTGAIGQISTNAIAPDQAAALQSAAPMPMPKERDRRISRADIFAGYSYLDPRSKLNGKPYNSLNEGMIFSAAYYFTHHLGLQAEGSYHFQSVNDGFYTVAGGPILRFPFAMGLTPFLHVLAGESQVTGPNIPTIGTSTFFYNPGTWGLNLTGGGGIDQNLPYFKHRLALRIIQADYQYMHPNFGPVRPTTGGLANIQAIRASAGLVYHIGSFEPPPALGLSCSAAPASVYAADQVIVSAHPTDVDPKKPLRYTWAASGGRIVNEAANASSITVDTTSLAAGNYTVAGTASQGNHTGESAACSASFTVNILQPTTVSCSANPATVNQGDMSAITAHGFSPQNRPLTYSYATTAGSILGTGTTATLGTLGAPPGPITVTCNVVDDNGKTASATADVQVQAINVAPKPLPSTQELCSILFVRDAKRPTRVDNEAKACLDQVALNLQRSPDAKAVLVGDAAASEPGGAAAAAQRAVNTKAYLVSEKGIDPSRIEVRTGTADAKMVGNYLLPAGADFSHDVSGTQTADPAVAPQKRVPLPMRHPAAKRKTTAKPSMPPAATQQ